MAHTVIPGFESALHNYLSRLGRDYDPLVVQSVDEWASMVQNLAFEASLGVKTLILPPGVGLSDPRLRDAATLSARTYYRPSGELFECPAVSYIADIDGELIPPAEGHEPGAETRYQILPANKIGKSMKEALSSGRQSLRTFEQDRTQFGGIGYLRRGMHDQRTRERQAPPPTAPEPAVTAGRFFSFFGRKPPRIDLPADQQGTVVPGSRQQLLYVSSHPTS